MANAFSSSTRRRTQRCPSPNSNCITPPTSPPPALPLSPTSTAEYWDHALEKHLKERRTRRESKSSRHSRHQNRAALDMTTSHEEEQEEDDDDTPVSNQRKCSASSFDFGFPERDRADSAHETEGVVESLTCPKDVRKQTSPQTLRVFPSSSKRASGRRREGQTLASPASLSPTHRLKTSTDEASPTSSSSPRRRKCPPRPPRPDDEILFIPSLCSVAQSSATRSNRSSASRSRRFAESIPEHSIAGAAITPPQSSRSSPSIATTSAAPKSCLYPSPELSPPMTPVHTAHFALHQTVSVWDSDDSDDDEDKEGLLRYVRRTLHHASKSSTSGGRSSTEQRRKSRERVNTGSEREKSSDDDSSDAKARSSRRRRRRSTMREAVIRVFGCS